MQAATFFTTDKRANALTVYAQVFMTNPTLGCETDRSPSQGGIGHLTPGLLVIWCVCGGGFSRKERYTRRGTSKNLDQGGNIDGQMDRTRSVSGRRVSDEKQIKTIYCWGVRNPVKIVI